MSNSSARQVGKRFSCPGCDALLKFKRLPTRLVQTCPNCRRLLRIQDKISSAGENRDLQAAIDEFVSRETLHVREIEYEEDPRLDQITTTESGVLQFNQPWPPGFDQVLLEQLEVLPNPHNLEGNTDKRQRLLSGFHRRVSMERTGEVEEIAIIGHWRDHQDGRANEGVLGTLARKIVRQLNKLPIDTVYAARINSAQWTIDDDKEFVEMFVDVAKSSSQKRSPPRQKIIR